MKDSRSDGIVSTLRSPHRVVPLQFLLSEYIDKLHLDHQNDSVTA